MNDPSWEQVKEYLLQAIDGQRDRLEARSQSHDESNFIRGLLAAYREILRMPETTSVNQSDRD